MKTKILFSRTVKLESLRVFDHVGHVEDRDVFVVAVLLRPAVNFDLRVRAVVGRPSVTQHLEGAIVNFLTLVAKKKIIFLF